MKAKPLMVQGTMSNAGKSLTVTAVCRVLARQGYRVAPFKSQNMALNSFVTKEGAEIGRAQAAQAEACKKEADVRMNPVLLKPTTDMGSQVIVLGKSVGNYTAREYFSFKKSLKGKILQAYESLAAENDVIVIEGAGSPVELNLNGDDIVNMGLARMVSAPVLLVGDIDRGGIFAQLCGTLSLLSPKDRERVKGLLVNKFRGDLSLFGEGRKLLQRLAGKPVLGVLPYTKIDIDDEDSLSERLKNKRERPRLCGALCGEGGGVRLARPRHSPGDKEHHRRSALSQTERACRAGGRGGAPRHSRVRGVRRVSDAGQKRGGPARR